MNTHVIRSAYYSEEDYKLILQLLRSKPGSLSFTDATDEAHSKIWEHESKILSNYYQEILSPSEQLELDEITTFMLWDDFFDLCDVYRQELSLKDEEFVIILTPHHNPENWFTSFADDRNNIFVHTGDWEYYLPNTPAVFPITYLVVSQVIQKSMYKTVDEKRNYAHDEALGCINDFCGTKSKISLKLRTADICPECLDDFTLNRNNDELLNQAFSLFEEIRAKVLYKQHHKSKPSRLHITQANEIKLIDYRNKVVSLTPLEKTVFFLYLKYPQGIQPDQLPEYENEIKLIYEKLNVYVPREILGNANLESSNTECFKRFEDELVQAELNFKEKFKESVTQLVTRTENSMAEKRSNIKRKFRAALGKDAAEYYIIKGARNEPFKINLDRSIVTCDSDIYGADIFPAKSREKSEELA